MNDFDEATRGPWEWDLKRLVASVNVAGRENGLNRKERRRAVMVAAFGFRWNINRLSTMGVLDVWSLLIYADRKPGVVKVRQKPWEIIQKSVAKAQRTTNETLLPKVAHRRHDGGWRFVDVPPILTRATTRRAERSLRRSRSTLRACRPRIATCCGATPLPTSRTASSVWAASACALTWC